MMRDVMPKLLFRLIVFYLFSAIPLTANNIYIAQSATGAANGADCADAQPVSFFNSSSNWGSGANQIGPGTTVHLCGTFTGTAGQTLLTFQGSGASGSPVTLKFETDANLAAPYWSSSGAINVSGRNWIVIDGGTNGTIQNTANGSGLAYMAQSNGFVLSRVSNVTVKNLAIANICQHTLGDTNTCQTGGNNSGGIAISGATNLTITKTTVHDAYTCIWYGGANGDSGVTLSYNTLSRCNWGIGGDQSGTSSALTVVGNDISCVVGALCNWDDTKDNFHHNGIMLFPQNGDTMNGVVISNNFVHDINGNTTAGIFLDPSGTGNIPNVQIYNNVLFTTPGQSGPKNNFIEPGAGVTGALVYNNTMSGAAATSMGVWNNGTMENNIVLSTVYGIGLSSGVTGVTSNYNDVYLLSGNFGNIGSSIYANWSAWLSGTGFDANSTSANPNLNASLMLTSGSPAAVHAGNNLTSLGVTGLDISAPQFFGVNYACGIGCVSRPSTGAWDMGAYQTSSSTTSRPSAPTNLTATVQ